MTTRSLLVSHQVHQRLPIYGMKEGSIPIHSCWSLEVVSTLQTYTKPAMGSEGHTLSMLFFPFLAQGHILPMLDMAKLFATRGVEATILTTPGNAPLVRPFLDRANAGGKLVCPMRLRLVPFPSDAGLPEGCENLSSVPSREMADLFFKFFRAASSLREPFEWALGELLPDCVVTDMFLPWTYEAAAGRRIPRLVFHGTNFFYLCVADSLSRHKPLESLPAEAETLVIPGLPHRIEMLRSQIPNVGEEAQELFSRIRESESKSYGVVVNSFLELEPDYARHYREVVGRRAWHVGPVALCNRDNADNSCRGYEPAIGHDECLKWLDSKGAGSVLYVCFGSMSDLSNAQLREIALGLEACERPFVWAVRSGVGGDEGWVPEGFEERVEGRGLVIRGWAPQILILNHPSVGGFLTHCGWNSTLEGVSAGLPLVTFPLFAEQFYNERLVVDVLRIGVSVGVKEYAMKPEERAVVDAAAIRNAAEEVMGSGEERRRRARELGEMALRAVGKGGSSYNDMSNLIQELMEKKNAKLQAQPDVQI